MESQLSIVVATPKQNEIVLLRQANAILTLKRKFIKGVHYGPPYPGSKKDTLHKPGAELYGRLFGLRPDYGTEALDKIIQPNFEDLSLSFILFRYRCQMRDIETGTIVGEAIGSCSSLEDKYRWRWVPKTEVPQHLLDSGNVRTKPGKATEYDFAITQAEITGTYGKPAEHWKMFEDAIADGRATVIEKTAKTGKKMKAWEIDTTVYRLLNENPLDLLNTVDKMAQKRAFVSAVIVSTGASAYFAPGDEAVTDLYDVPTDDDSDMVEDTFEVLEEGSPVPSSFPPDIRVEKVESPASEESPLPTWPTAESIGTLLNRAAAQDGLGLERSEVKRLLGIESLEDIDEWGKKFATREEAAKTLKSRAEAEWANGPKATPKSAPPAEKSEWSAEDLAVAEFLFMDYDLADNAAALALVGAKTWAECKNLNVAREKLMMQCIARKVPMIATGAKYVKTAKQTYVEFTTPTAIRLYGRDLLRALGTEWFLYAEAWQPGETYQFGQDQMLPLKVTWEKKNNYFQATAVAIHSDAIEEPVV